MYWRPASAAASATLVAARKSIPSAQAKPLHSAGAATSHLLGLKRRRPAALLQPSGTAAAALAGEAADAPPPPASKRPRPLLCGSAGKSSRAPSSTNGGAPTTSGDESARLVELQKEKWALTKALREKESKVTQMRLCANVKSVDEIRHLQQLTLKWRRICQEALLELKTKTANSETSMDAILLHLGVKASVVCWNPVDGEFVDDPAELPGDDVCE